MADIVKFSGKQKHEPATHVVRVDLVPIVALYYLHVQNEPAKAQIFFHLFASQGLHTAAIRVTREQYDLFKIATKHIIQTIEAAYTAYQKDADNQ